MAFFAPFLKLDFSYLPMLLTSFALGYVPGIMVLLVKNIIRLLATDTAGVGQLADVIIGLAMLLPATAVYRAVHSRKGALIGMLLGTATMAVVGVVVNKLILLPFFLGDGLTAYMEQNPAILWTAILPFNLVKGGVVCAVTFVIYKSLAPFLKRGLRGR